MKPKSPCFGCNSEIKELGCHSICEDYIPFVDANEARKAKIRKAKEQEGYRYYLSAEEFRKTKNRSSNTFKQHKK